MPEAASTQRRESIRALDCLIKVDRKVLLVFSASALPALPEWLPILPERRRGSGCWRRLVLNFSSIGSGAWYTALPELLPEMFADFCRFCRRCCRNGERAVKTAPEGAARHEVRRRGLRSGEVGGEWWAVGALPESLPESLPEFLPILPVGRRLLVSALKLGAGGR